MTGKRRRWRWLWLPAAALILGVSAFLLEHVSPVEPRGAEYEHRQTRDIVRFVEDAADRVRREGAAAFQAFRQPDGPWQRDDRYLFAYDLEGNCVLHPVEPALEGRNLLGMKDILGKPVIQKIVEIGRREGPDAAGWVFYFWEEGRQLVPEWKSAYVRKAVAPDGTPFMIGSGIYRAPVERVFVQDLVDAAVKRLQEAGREAAFRAFRDPSSPFVLQDTYVFVLDRQGRILADPAYPEMTGREMMDHVDARGQPVIRLLMEKLEEGDPVWVTLYRNEPHSRIPSKHALYARKARVGDEELIVCSSLRLASPIWIRH